MIDITFAELDSQLINNSPVHNFCPFSQLIVRLKGSKGNQKLHVEVVGVRNQGRHQLVFNQENSMIPKLLI
jgi:hypothetical protein